MVGNVVYQNLQLFSFSRGRGSRGGRGRGSRGSRARAASSSASTTQTSSKNQLSMIGCISLDFKFQNLHIVFVKGRVVHNMAYYDFVYRQKNVIYICLYSHNVRLNNHALFFFSDGSPKVSQSSTRARASRGRGRAAVIYLSICYVA